MDLEDKNHITVTWNKYVKIYVNWEEIKIIENPKTYKPWTISFKI